MTLCDTSVCNYALRLLSAAGSCHKYHFCRDKGFVATNTCLKGERERGRNISVATKDVFCRDKHVFNDTCGSSCQ